MSEKYTKKISIPQYVPSGKPVGIADLLKTDKYVILKKEIMEKFNAGLITKEEANFLVLAATRHILFKYARIADYYSVATEEMQRLMERSALVLLDLEDAVKNEFTMGRAFIELLKQNTLGEREKPAEYGELPDNV